MEAEKKEIACKHCGQKWLLLAPELGNVTCGCGHRLRAADDAPPAFDVEEDPTPPTPLFEEPTPPASPPARRRRR